MLLIQWYQEYTRIKFQNIINKLYVLNRLLLLLRGLYPENRIKELHFIRIIEYYYCKLKSLRRQSQLKLFLLQVKYECQYLIENCYFCQYSKCLQCNDDYILYFKNNICYPKSKNHNANFYFQNFQAIVTFLYFNYSFIDITLNKQYYLVDCLFNDFNEVYSIMDVQCDRDILYLTNQNQKCQQYCLSCLDNRTCINYQYLIDFNINLTGRYISNKFELEINNNYIMNIEMINLFELYTNTINILINKVTHYFFQTPANIQIPQKGQNINIQFTNASILDDEYLYFEESVTIINSQFRVFKKFGIKIETIESIRKFKSNSQFILKNVLFVGQNNNSFLVFELKCERVQLQNVTFQSFSGLRIVIQTNKLSIVMLNLINLNIEKKNYVSIFTVYTDQFHFNGLNIHTCQFRNILMFEFFSTYAQIQNVLIFKVQFKDTKLLQIFFNNKMEKFILNQFFIYQTISDNSILFLVDIQNQISLSRIILKNNVFTNSKLAYCAQGRVNLTEFLISDSDFYKNYFFIFLSQCKTIDVSKFLIHNIKKCFGQLMFLQSQHLLQINQILFKNCSFYSNNQTGLQGFLTITGINRAQIISLYFIDIKTSINLIDVFLYQGLFDNIQIIDIQMLEQLSFIIRFHKVEYEITQQQTDKITFKNMILDRIQHSYQEMKNDQNSSIVIISSTSFLFHNLLVSNIKANLFNLLTILSNDFQVRNFKVYNITITYLIFSIASNILDQIYIQQTYAYKSLFCFEKLEFNIQQIQIHESSTIESLFYLYQEIHGHYSIYLTNIIINQVNTEGFFNFFTKYTTIKLNNILINQSNFTILIHWAGQFTQFVIKFLKVQDVLFKSKESLVIYCNIFEISHILFIRTQNLGLIVASSQFYINNIMFLNSQIQFFRFQNENSTNTKWQIINGMHFINNSKVESDLNYLVIFKFQNDQMYIIGLHIHNNTITGNDSASFQIEAQVILQVSLTNNKCGYYCIGLGQTTKIIFKESNIIQNQFKSASPLKIGFLSRVINFTIESTDNYQMAIQINQKKFIHGQKQLLYLPSGQKLIDYKIFDYQHIQLKQQIYNITIINNNMKSSLILGLFIIKAYEYDWINKKIVKDLSQFQNFQVFEQSQTLFGLNKFQIIYNPYQQNVLMIEIQKQVDNQQKLTLFAKTQLCQMGEILIQNKCLVCNPLLKIYSLKQKSNFCSVVDEQIMSDHLPGAIQLRKGYWRPFIYNSFIQQCDDKIDRCQGGWRTGDISCKIGYIGAICNSCDIYNTRGDGYYQFEQNECKMCGEFNYIYLLFKLISIILMQIIDIIRLCLKLILLLYSNIQNYKKLILQRQVNSKHFYILVKYISDIPSLIFTIFIGNLAILKMMIQDQIILPDILTIFTNPIIFEQNSSQCIQQFMNLDYNYWLYYFKLMIPILTYNIFVLLIVMLIKRQNIMKTFFILPIISLFLTQGPTLLVLLSQQVLYTTYSNVKYANFDNSIRYYGKIHQHNIHNIILPLILLLKFIFPMMFIIFIRKQVKKIFKDTFIQLGNFILPFKSNYQELFNYFKNFMLLLLLSLNDKQLSYSNKTFLITLIMYFNFKYEIYKIKFLSIIASQQAMNLVWILCFTYFCKQIIFFTPFNILIILTSLFIIQQFKIYIHMLFNQNKLFILETLKNRSQIIKYLGLKNYIQCLQYWKLIKQNHKFRIKQQQIKNLNEEQNCQNINDQQLVD